ncbi:MAG TPA: TIGR03013 family XrtA/PEP-CTERM system glycosyltransferase [Casimicrobiaceae bacterium]|nr:TIGR03013 family XrtA/PEP-CTERM system glycosyltransferase [Casimicrobiaceae bacterium]
MFSALRQNFTAATIAQLAVEALWLFVAGLAVMQVSSHMMLSAREFALPALVFAMLMLSLNSAFGVYRRGEGVTPGAYVVRLLLAPAVGVPLAYVAANVVPGGWVFQENVGMVVVFAIGGLLLLRHALLLPLIAALLPHRVLVLGTGPEARMVETSLAAAHPPGLRLLGFRALEKVPETEVSPGQVVDAGRGLCEYTRDMKVDEIIVAVRQQRGGVLPLRELLDCRLQGVEITDLARFFERVHGKVPIELVKVSWLIYGNGYRQGWLRTSVKRLFDVGAALSLLLLTLPIMIVTALAIRMESGAPVIYRQERVGFGGRLFTVFKFRSMGLDAEKGGQARWAVARDPRVTRVGRVIRRLRIDELPQLFNVLRGEMSFVGPRPERPEFVELLTGQIPFYAVRHSVKPGLTGWAQVRYSYGASVEQSVRKLEYDLYYVKNHTLALDVLILLETVRVVLLGEGAH